MVKDVTSLSVRKTSMTFINVNSLLKKYGREQQQQGKE